MGDSTIATVGDETSFDTKVLKATKPVLVMFTAGWNGPAKPLEPIVQELALVFESQLLTYKCDTDESPLTAEKSGVRSVPTLHIYKNGKRHAEHVGLLTKAQLVQLIESSLRTL
ncbi:thioredoxin family protein [Pseudomonas sp. DSP3-2-2]|uniref:thioredoxin family protein n=1 Tax=unclassified Pseudomonas TaxID=196821 RepID=UPI003CED7B20